MQPIDDAVRGAFAAVFGRPAPANADLHRSETPDWSSLKHIELLFAVEACCGVRFDEAELSSLASLSEIVRRVKAMHAA